MAKATFDNEMRKQRVLCVGLVCLDIVKVVAHFPQEDTDQRCEDCLWRRGGNAANTSTVLSLLSSHVEFLGTLSNGPYLEFLKTGFSENGVKFDHCPVVPSSESPVSVIILNKSSGSRTILHTNKNLQELTFEDFAKVPLSKGHYSWIHFEGRPNIEALKRMLMHVAEYNSTCEESRKIVVSLEIEKVQRVPHLLQLVQYTDYVFVSKEAAYSMGHTDMKQAVEALVAHCIPSGAVICAWGDQGAAAKAQNSPAVTSPAFPPPILMDSIGAGDTFNAAAIFALNCGKSLQEAVTFACRVAGLKCGMMGNEGLKGMEALLSG